MKKLFATLAVVVVTLTASAQSSVVYYTPVNKTMEVGIGFDPYSHKCIFSIIEESKNDVDFTFDILNHNGQSVLGSTKALSEGKINIIPKTRKVSYYACNYELTIGELKSLIRTANDNGKVVINGVEFDGEELASMLKDIEDKWFKPAGANDRGRFFRPGRPAELRG